MTNQPAVAEEAAVFTLERPKTAHAQLAEIVETVIATDDIAVDEMKAMGIAPPKEATALTQQLRTALNAYRIAEAASASFPLRQLVAGALGAVARGDTAEAAQWLTTTTMLLDYTGQEEEAQALRLVQQVRDMRQQVMLGWAIDRFGDMDDADGRTNSIGERNRRFLEEAIELYQAVAEEDPTAMALHTARAKAHELVDFIFDRPPGEIEREIGGVTLTLGCLAEVLGRSVAAEEMIELRRVLTMPREHFQERQRVKRNAGF